MSTIIAFLENCSILHYTTPKLDKWYFQRDQVIAMWNFKPHQWNFGHWYVNNHWFFLHFNPSLPLFEFIRPFIGKLESIASLS